MINFQKILDIPPPTWDNTSIVEQSTCSLTVYEKAAWEAY